MGGNDNTKGQNEAVGLRGGELKASKIMDTVKKLMRNMKDATEGDLASYENLLKENEILKNKLETKKKDVERLDSDLTKLQKEKEDLVKDHQAKLDTQKKKYDDDLKLFFDKFAQQASTWKADTNAREQQEQQITALKEKVTKAEAESKTLRDKLAKKTEEAQKFKVDFTTANNKQIGLDAQLVAKKIELQNALDLQTKLLAQQELYGNEIGVLHPNLDTIGSRLKELSERCHILVHDHFYSSGVNVLPFSVENIPENIPGATGNELRAWLTVPQNGCIHMAAAEVVICRTLCSAIFQPFYVLKDTYTKQLLEDLRESAPRHEAILRCQLALATPPAEAQKMALEAATFTAKLLMDSDAERYGSLETELCTLFGDAVTVWQEAQRNETPIEISDVVDDCWNADEKYNDYDSLVTLNDDERYPMRRTNSVATLFPQVFVRHRDDDDDKQSQSTIFTGRALWSTQNAAMAAWWAYECADRRGPRSPGKPARQSNAWPHQNGTATNSHATTRFDLPPVDGNYTLDPGPSSSSSNGTGRINGSNGSNGGSIRPDSPSRLRSAAPRLTRSFTRRDLKGKAI